MSERVYPEPAPWVQSRAGSQLAKLVANARFTPGQVSGFLLSQYDVEQQIWRWFLEWRQASDWRPIESAPKDGRELLGWYPYHAAHPPGGGVYVMRWYDDRHAAKPIGFFEASGWVWGRRDNRQRQPTHWMPLPEPPK